MRKTILTIAVAGGCLIGLQATAFAASAPQTLNTNDTARLQRAHSGYRHQSRAPRLYDYDQGTFGGYDGPVAVPYAAGH
jgi:hypothetical protein